MQVYENAESQTQTISYKASIFAIQHVTDVH
jgi:hypothetical protein